MNKRLLILYTGGTIGMTNSAEGYVPLAGFDQLLKQHLGARAFQQLPDYELLEFERLIDSANVTPADWSRIADAIAQRWEDYNGFIVLHGTDTMAYTASALSFLLKGSNKPVILTGSQIPLVELRNDAQDNLVTAMLLATHYPITEVCIYFNGRLLRGNRSRKLKSAGFDAFDSPNFPRLAEVGIQIKLQQHLLLDNRQPDFTTPTFDTSAVCILPLYPGISPRVLDNLLDSGDVKGLIMQSYGVGNAPDANKPLMQSLGRAAENGVLILNTTQCLQGEVLQGTYATGNTLNQLGVISGRDLTLEAAFAKLHYLISQALPDDQLRAALNRSICGELTEPTGE